MSYISRMYRAPSAFDLIHSDVWGPSLGTAPSQPCYYVTFIDDYTRSWVYLIHNKSEVFFSLYPFFTNDQNPV